MLMERSKVPSEPKKRDAKNPVDARREVVSRTIATDDFFGRARILRRAAAAWEFGEHLKKVDLWQLDPILR